LGRDHDVDDLHLNQVATSQRAIGGLIQERKVSLIFCNFEAKLDCPHMLWFRRTLPTDDAAFVPSWAKCAKGWQFGVSLTDPLIRHALPQRQPDVY
jgi:hypothetical protein